MVILPSHLEQHATGRTSWLRAAVLGANDGLVSTASLILGVAASGADRGAVVTAGIAGLVAGAMSMAAGEYVSVSSQRDAERADIARETRELADDPGTLGRASERLVELSFGYVDGLSAAITDLFLGERQRLVRSAELARAEVVAALLAGEAVDVDAAERRLGHPLRGHHLGLVLWAEGGEATDEPLGRLESEAQRLADAAGGRALLRIPVGGRLLWAWIAGDAPLDDRALRAAPPAARRGRPAGEAPAPREPDAASGPPPAALHVAIGAPAAGPAGFVRSHQDALETRRVALLAPRPSRLSRYRDADLLALLTGDEERARRFVETRLGALAEDEDGARRLRVTLRAHLEERGSNVAVARRLGIHENTVKYRVRKAHELLSAGAADDDPLALGAALRLADLLPALDVPSA